MRPGGQAVGSARGQWIALSQYTEDGDFDVDNNLDELGLQIVAIRRKNWLLAGSDAGAEQASFFFAMERKYITILLSEEFR